MDEHVGPHAFPLNTAFQRGYVGDSRLIGGLDVNHGEVGSYRGSSEKHASPQFLHCSHSSLVMCVNAHSVLNALALPRNAAL
jgi:hypothetical protein